MFKKTSLIFSLLIMLSIVLSACNAKTGTTKSTPGAAGAETSLPSQGLTAVATVVSGANESQTAAASTPFTAGGTPSITSTITSTVTVSGTAEGTQVPSYGGSTPAPTVLATSSGPSSYTVDWQPIWTEFFNNMPADHYIISVNDLEAKINSGTVPFLLDVRDPSEITQYGYIKGAVNIPWRNVLDSLNMLPAQDQSIIVYSGNEYRGTVIMLALRLLGYTDVYVLDGGMQAWQRAQKPSETLVPPTTPTAGTTPNVDQTKLSDLRYFITSNSYGITPQDLSGQLTGATKPFILDVRQRVEVTSKGYMAGSTNIPLNSLMRELSQLPADKSSTIIVYDSTGTRGTIATMALQMIGYKNARSVYGGLNAWVDAGLPYVK